MSDIAGKVSEWRRTGWKGRTQAELRQACQHLQIDIAAGDTIERLTQRLLDHDGAQTHKASAGPLAENAIARGLRAMPELRKLTSWGGRRRRIQVMPRAGEDGDQHFHISWEGEAYRLDPKLEYQDVPWPVYEALKNATTADLRTKWKPEDRTMDRWWIKSPRFPFVDMGDTPGTSDLPIDARDWYVRHAIANGDYAEWDKDELEPVFAALTDQQRPNERDRDRNANYWRREILQMLGRTPEQLESAA